MLERGSKFRGQLLQRFGFVVFDQGEQGVCREFSFESVGLSDRRQPEVGGGRPVVEADDREVAWNFESAGASCLHRAVCEAVR